MLKFATTFNATFEGRISFLRQRCSHHAQNCDSMHIDVVDVVHRRMVIRPIASARFRKDVICSEITHMSCIFDVAQGALVYWSHFGPTAIFAPRRIRLAQRRMGKTSET
jgi:hypothetical protein